MAQDRLHCAQICAIFHHVRGTTVPQHVRTDITSCARGSGANHLPDALPAQLPCASSEEQERRSLPFRENWSPVLHVLGQRILCALPQGHNPFLVALSAYQHVTQIELQVFELDSDDLGNTQRGGVKNFEHGSIPLCPCFCLLAARSWVRTAQHGFDLVAGQRLG